jgi:hypothetical protein
MDEDDVALLDPVGLAQKILRGEPLEHHRRACLVGNPARQLDQQPRFDIVLLGIAAAPAGIGDPVARFQTLLDLRSDLDDLACSLAAKRERQARRIETDALIDVHVVDPNRMLAHPDLPPARRRQLDLLEPHDLRTACLMDTDRAHGYPSYVASEAPLSAKRGARNPALPARPAGARCGMRAKPLRLLVADRIACPALRDRRSGLSQP